MFKPGAKKNGKYKLLSICLFQYFMVLLWVFLIWSVNLSLFKVTLCANFKFFVYNIY